MADIKVVINNRNRLTTTKNLVEHLLRLNPDEKIIIIDNESTYQPLLEWYKQIEGTVDIRYEGNHGHLAVWSIQLIKELGQFFVYTDSDIELNPNFPQDWKRIMLEYWEKYKIKVALALDIENLPDHYRFKNQVIRNEGRWWSKELEPNVFEAHTDTTFFLIQNFGDNQYDSVRLAHPNFVSRHVPWYLDLKKLDEEEVYFLNNLGARQKTQYSCQNAEPYKYNDI